MMQKLAKCQKCGTIQFIITLAWPCKKCGKKRFYDLVSCDDDDDIHQLYDLIKFEP